MPVLIILYFSPLLWYGRTYSVVRSEVAQSCVTLWNPMECSLPGSSVHGIFQGSSYQQASTCKLLFQQTS